MTISKPDKDYLLFHSISNYDFEMFKRALSNGANINAHNLHKDTSLHLLATKGFTKWCRFAIENGADINCQNSSLRTPLINAALTRHPDVVKLLIEHKADVDISDNYQETAFSLSVYESLKIAELLLDYGANINYRNSDGKTPLMDAVDRERHEIVDFLLSKDCDVNGHDNNGDTALITATVQGNFQLVKELLDRGADLFAVDKNNLTALDFAKNSQTNDERRELAAYMQAFMENKILSTNAGINNELNCGLGF